MEDQFNKFGFGKMKKKDGSVEETPGSCKSFYEMKLYSYLEKSNGKLI
jgi:hypothetical protein